MKNLDLFVHPITGELTPFHPRTGLQALCSKKRGGWLWPVMGASEDDGAGGENNGGGEGSGGKKSAVDQFGNDLGYPADTAPGDMSDAQQAKFYKHQQRRKDDKLKEYGGITPEEAKQFKADADKNRREGLKPDERAIDDARTEGAAAAASQWAPVLAEEIAKQFIPNDDSRKHVMAGIDPLRFVKDGNFDRQGLADHLKGLQTAFGGGDGSGNGSGSGGGNPSQWGQGNGRKPEGTKESDAGLAEAKRRGYIKD